MDSGTGTDTAAGVYLSLPRRPGCSYDKSPGEETGAGAAKVPEMLPTLTSLFVIALAAVAAPILADYIPGIRVPCVVLEMVLGILIGPQVLGLARPDMVINTFSDFGLAFLFFLAGFEVDLARIWGRPLRLAGISWGASLGAALVIATALRIGGLPAGVLFVALAMSTTTLGTLVPILSDSGTLVTKLGVFTVAAGTVGEFVPIVASALFLDESRRLAASAVAINLFGLGVLAAIILARRFHPARLTRLVKQTIHSSPQLAVRLSLLLLIFLIYLAAEFGLDILLGAFAAGMVVKQVVANSERHALLTGQKLPGSPDYVAVLRSKYEGIGYGFVIPVFFITVGMSFDLRGLLSSITSLALVPLFLTLFLVVRGLPVLVFYRGALPFGQRRSLALFCATELPLVIAITQLGVDAGRMDTVVAAGMVGAGMLSVFIYPVLGLARAPSPSINRPPNLSTGPETALEGTISELQPES